MATTEVYDRVALGRDSHNIWPTVASSIGSRNARQARYSLGVQWMLDQGITTALWGAVIPVIQPAIEVVGCSLDASAKGRDRADPARNRTPSVRPRNSWPRVHAASLRYQRSCLDEVSLR